MKMDASPYHQRPSSMTIVLANTIISKSLSWTPPDALSGIIVAETVARLICELHLTPALSSPVQMEVAPRVTSLAMDLGQRHVDGSCP